MSQKCKNQNPIPYIFIKPDFVKQELINAAETTQNKLTKPMQHQPKPSSEKTNLKNLKTTKSMLTKKDDKNLYQKT